MERARQFEELLDRSGINSDDIERVDRMNIWQGFIKNEEGKIETTDLLSMQVKPKDKEKNLEDYLVREAAPTKITPSRRKRPEKPTDERTFLIGGDSQIPFEDPRAMELFQLVNAEKRPDELVLVGDMLDLAPISRFEGRPEWANSTQESIDRYHMFLAQLRADNPDGKITVVHGNHEERLNKYIAKNAAEVLGLRRAMMAHELAVLSIQSLVRYDDLRVNGVEGWPNGTYWPEEQEALKFIHGTNTKKGGSNAAQYLASERESTIYGHTHRQEVAYRTFARRLGGYTIAAASPGALCLTDGTVPGFNSTRTMAGDVVRKEEDWQKGALWGTLDSDGNVELEPGLMTNRGIKLDGTRYNIG